MKSEKKKAEKETIVLKREKIVLLGARTGIKAGYVSAPPICSRHVQCTM